MVLLSTNNTCFSCEIKIKFFNYALLSGGLPPTKFVRWRIATELKLRMYNENLIFLFLNQIICCVYSNEPFPTKFVRWRIATELKLRIYNENLIFLFLNQIICCVYSNEPFQ